MSTTPEKVTSAHVRAALKLRYPEGSHALMWEVAPSTGSATRYADAVAVGLWASHGHRIEGIEVKVSRADFLSEMKQPEKSQPVFQFCDRWWLACPKGMVKPEELPTTWGLLELSGDTLREKVRAPKLTPVPPNIGFFASLARRCKGADDEMTALAHAKELSRLRADLEQGFQRRYEQEHSHRIKKAEEGMAILERVKEQTGFDLGSYTFQEDSFIAAVQAISKLGGKYHSPFSQLRQAASCIIRELDESGLTVPE